MKNYDVTIIMPPKWDYREPWTAPAYICEYLRHLGCNVQFLDYNIRLYNACKEIGLEDLWTSSEYFQGWVKGEFNILSTLLDLNEIQGDIVGFSTTLTNREFTKHLAAKIRNRFPNKKIMMGGHILFFQHEVDDMPLNRADFICKGEAEYTLRDLFENDFENMESIAGLYLPQNDKWQLTSDRDLIKDLDSIPFPTFEEIDTLQAYPVPDLPLMSSRGCISRCIFCNDRIRTPLYRTRSAVHQVDELQYLKERYDTDFFIYNDPLMNGNLRVLEEKADELIRRNLDVQYGGNIMIRPDMPEDLFKKLRQSGLTVAIMGVETGSTTTAKAMRKRHTREEAAAFIRSCKNAGMRVELNLIVGFPTETEEHFEETLSFLEENQQYIDCVVSAATFNIAFSDLWEKLDEFNIVKQNYSVHNSWYTKDLSNTLDIRLERLKRLVETASGMGIMNVRTDYEIEKETSFNLNTLADKYEQYWKNKTDCSDEERKKNLAIAKELRHRLTRQKVLKWITQKGLLKYVVAVRQKLGYV